MWTFGGETTGPLPLATVTQFQFPLAFTGTSTVTVSAPASLPAPRVGSAAVAMPPGFIQASSPVTDEVRVLLFGGLSGGQAITDTLFLTYTVELPPVQKLYLPLILRDGP